MSMRSRLLLALLLFAPAPRLLAQKEVEPADLVRRGFVRNAQAISQAEARSRCPAQTGRPRGCKPVEMVDLGVAGGRRWSAGIYEWVITDTVPERAGRDTVLNTRGGEAVVVFSAARPGGPLRPEWHGEYRQSYVYEVMPQVGDAPGGGALLGLTVCWFGTAACGEQFLAVRRAEGWHPVRKRWAEGLPAALRDRGSRARIVPSTLGGWTSLWDGPRPSGGQQMRWLVLGLKWQGDDALVLRSYRVTSRDPFRPHPQWRTSVPPDINRSRQLHPGR
ncbi:MAG TPA: hypothetical protein VFE05_20365 [Longimicrobiaceae bacterium]|jgi:hypothetical protein|nr:hypothetical protein [Longimicrobiaceae bacterium]